MRKKLMAVAVIPARGGSKGIPRKNLRILGGESLVARSIHAAQRASLIRHVFVSTDDAEIAAAAGRCGASVIVRPEAIAGSSASSEAALLHAMGEIERVLGVCPDILVFLQCTSPFTLSREIDGAIQALISKQMDCVLAVTASHSFLWRNGADGASGVNHDHRNRLPRQKLQPQYLETGAIYAMRWGGFKKARHRFFGRIGLYETPAGRSVEIDEPADLELAEALLSTRQSADKSEVLPKNPGALILDFDGVFTDNRVLVQQDGREAVFCNRSDGQALAALKRLGLPILVLSAEVNPVVGARCRKLGLTCIPGTRDKLPVLLKWLKSRRISPKATIYVGNDINDVGCMNAVGCAVAVGDAQPEALRAAHLTLALPGGKGAIRELCGLILRRIGN